MLKGLQGWVRVTWRDMGDGLPYVVGCSFTGYTLQKGGVKCVIKSCLGNDTLPVVHAW